MMVLVKLIVRPWVLSRDTSPVLEIIALSFPSLIEAIVVLTIVFGLVSAGKAYALPVLRRLSRPVLLALSVVLVGTYVLTQELSPQNLGGANVVDPWDIVASLVGLAVMSLLFARYGMLEDAE
ncbi:MAG: hypothetical protein R2834_02530 [Rhodothermales bacterium]